MQCFNCSFNREPSRFHLLPWESCMLTKFWNVRIDTRTLIWGDYRYQSRIERMGITQISLSQSGLTVFFVIYVSHHDAHASLGSIIPRWCKCPTRAATLHHSEIPIVPFLGDIWVIFHIECLILKEGLERTRKIVEETVQEWYLK